MNVDPLPILTRYFDALVAGRFEEAADCFSPDVFYSHPAYLHEPLDAPRHEANGRADLLEIFAIRGKRLGSPPRIETCISSGRHAFISAVILNQAGEVGMSFVSELTLDDDGLISTYAAYRSVPPVGAALAARS